MNAGTVSIRRARREDVAAIVAMLADDHLGRARERAEDPLPPAYYEAFERVERDPNLTLVVAESEGRVVGCLQLAVLLASARKAAPVVCSKTCALPLIVAAAASASNWCNGPSRKRKRAAAIWSNC